MSRSVTDEAFVCPECGDECSSRSDVEIHLLVAHPYTPSSAAPVPEAIRRNKTRRAAHRRGHAKRSGQPLSVADVSYAPSDWISEEKPVTKKAQKSKPPKQAQTKAAKFKPPKLPRSRRHSGARRRMRMVVLVAALIISVAFALAMANPGALRVGRGGTDRNSVTAGTEGVQSLTTLSTLARATPAPLPEPKTVTGDGFSLTLPAQWLPFDGAPPADVVKAAISADPYVGVVSVEQLKGLMDSNRLVAFDGKSPSRMLGLTITPASGESLDELSLSVPKELTAAGAGSVQPDLAILDGGHALRLSYLQPVVVSGITVSVQELRYVRVDGGKMYTLTFASADPVRDTATFHSIANSLQTA